MLVVTMNDEGSIQKGGWLLIRDGVIERIGVDAPPSADREIDASGMVLLPGLINTHHHMYQTLTRNLPGAQDVQLFDWLTTLYDVWGELTEEAVYVSTQVALAELILSGCTTTSDHLYLFPTNASRRLIDTEIKAAAEFGVRFHPTRGSMSHGRRGGGLPPDDIVQREEEILEDSVRLIEKYHDPSRYSMIRIALAPCSPFSVTLDLMKKSRELADRYGVRLHTHIAETVDEEAYCLERYGMRPVELAESVGWLGKDVWFAHGVHLNDNEIKLLAATGTGLAHCPTSNMRLGSGIAPVARLLDAGAPVSLAVDGSASNDASNMLLELRQTLLLHRLRGDRWLTAQEVLRIATRGGAKVLGRDDIGIIEPDAAADMILIDMNDVGYSGGLSDPLAALVFCVGSARVAWSIINGKVVVADGEIAGIDVDAVSRRANEISEEMQRRAHITASAEA